MDFVRLLDFGEVSPLRSQALYHGLARVMTESSPDTIVLCQSSETCFCVGYHQDPQAELDIEFCRTHGYPVLHRQIGGGTVVLDRDQILYQIILHASRAPLRIDSIYEKFLAAPVATLCALGGLARRIAVEERALAEHLGPEWAAFAQTRKRLIPMVW